jgi:photosystem II stability/assembly factor-like uncharacterized protein
MVRLVAWLVMTAEPQLVDASVHEFEGCIIERVSFRSPTQGVALACDTVFKTDDGGRGWTRASGFAEVFGEPARQAGERIAWLSLSVGLEFARYKPIARTTDAGLSWKPVAMTVSGFVYAAESVGAQAWFCDSSGTIAHSTDSGATWRRSPQLFRGSGDLRGSTTRPRCKSLSFIDGSDGWALGGSSLWKTTDGGLTWKVSNAPALGAADDTAEKLIRLTPRIAWIKTSNGDHFRTLDAGATWTPVAPGSTSGSRSAVRLADGRARVLQEHPSEDPTTWVPDFEPTTLEAAFDSAPAFGVDVANRSAVLTHSTVVSTGTGATVPLELLWQHPGTPRIGVAGKTPFLVNELGVWYGLKALPVAPDQIAALEDGKWLVRTGARITRRGEEPADDADLNDWDRLHGLTPPPERSLACLQRGPGTLQVEWSYNGCFGSQRHALTLTLGAERWRLERAREDEAQADSLTAVAAQELVARVSAAALKPHSWCYSRSTTTEELKLSWSCDGGATHSMEFETSASSCQPGGYERALGIIRVVEHMKVTDDGQIKFDED